MAAVALATVAVGSTLYSARQNKVAQHRQERAARTQKRMRNYQTAVERRKQVSQAIRARAEMTSTAAQSGTFGSSADISGMGNINNQAATNVGHLNTMLGFNDQLESHQSAINKANTQSANAQALANVSMAAAPLFKK